MTGSHEVRGSTPLSSTIFLNKNGGFTAAAFVSCYHFLVSTMPIMISMGEGSTEQEKAGFIALPFLI